MDSLDRRRDGELRKSMAALKPGDIGEAAVLFKTNCG
jgi:hypothetical protein